MPWIYSRARRQTGTVRVILVDNTLNDRHEMEILKLPDESEQDFIARGQAMIEDRLAGLQRRQDGETDVTNIFRPPQQKG